MPVLPPHTLFCFAHKGEARSFLRHYRFSVVSFPIDGFYQSGPSYALITGEGIQQTTEKLSAILGGYWAHIKQIINLGVCGSLDNQIAREQFLTIRTCYGESPGGVHFRSFSTSDRHTTVDCISSQERVVNKDYAERLGCFAQVVDRELWAVGSMAKRFNMPFQSAKLVIDQAGIDTEEVCATLDREEIGLRILSGFSALFSGERGKVIAPLKEDLALPPAFYLTVSQRRQLEDLVGSLVLKLTLSQEAVLNKASIGAISQAAIKPKQRTQQLLANLHAMVNPFETGLQKKLAQLALPLSEAGFEVRFSPHFEQDWVDIKARIAGPHSTARLVSGLQQFPYQKVRALLNGEPDAFADKA